MKFFVGLFVLLFALSLGSGQAANLVGPLEAQNNLSDVQNPSAALNAIGGFPITGGTITGSTTFSAAGTGLTVTNNASVGGVLSPFQVNFSSEYNVSVFPYISKGFNYLFGTSSTSTNSYGFQLVDQASVSNGSNAFSVIDEIGGGIFAGGRTGIYSFIYNSASLPNDQNAYVSMSALASGGTPGGTQINPVGNFWSFVANTFASGCCLSQIYSTEIDMQLAAGGYAAIKIGLDIVLQTQDAVRGDKLDSAIEFATDYNTTTPGWKTGILFGGSSNYWAFGNSDSTLIGIHQRDYQGTVQTFGYLYGIDFRAGTTASGGCAFTSLGFCVGPVGQTSVEALVTSGSVQAQTATLTGVTVVDGGGFLTIPTLTVQPSPAGGTTATATVATMGLMTDLAGLQTIVNNGTSGCSGSTGTVSGGTSSVPATVTVTTSGGVVTSMVTATQGTYTVLPTSPVTITGITGCSGAVTANLTWAIKSITTTPGSGYSATALPWIFHSLVPSSGSGHAADFIASMTPASAPLALNPSGGTVNAGPAVLIANLPACNSNTVGFASVTNGVASPTYNSTVSTTGSSNQVVWCNGSSWTYH